jgi:hypothetical protein
VGGEGVLLIQLSQAELKNYLDGSLLPNTDNSLILFGALLKRGFAKQTRAWLNCNAVTFITHQLA